MAKKRPTIKDIARIAKVSPTTVSMALHDHPRISTRTRKRILRIAKRENYQPSLVARALVGKGSYSIGLIVSSLTDPFYPELAQAVEENSLQLGYNMILCSTKNDIGVEKYCIDSLRSRGVDGIIISSAQLVDPNVESLIEGDFPTVLVNRRIKNEPLAERVDYVVVDNFLGAHMLMEHLFRLGHDRIGMITGLLNTSTGFERAEGAKRFLGERGLQLDPKLLTDGGYSRELASVAARKLLNLNPRPSAIFAASDEMALAAREAILDLGLHIPQDIALVGFDGIDATGYRRVEITTVAQRRYEMGSMALKILIDRIEKRTPPMTSQVIMKPDMVIRDSCGYRLYGYKPDRSLKAMNPTHDTVSR
jgi:LacI family transcriptional regulator